MSQQFPDACLNTNDLQSCCEPGIWLVGIGARRLFGCGG
jgi:hypothetical protein